MKTQNRLDNEAKDCIRCNIKKREATNKICSSCRMKEWRKKNPDKIKAYLKRSEKQRKKVRENYYEEHQEYFNNYSREYRKRTNNVFDKIGKRKHDSLVRSKTRAKYHIVGVKCEFCKDIAKNRHHTTEPMEVDKFLFLCEKCHDKIHGIKRYNKHDLLSEK